MTKNFREKYPTLAIFEEHVKGIRNIIKAADIYALHIISDFRNTEIDRKLVNKIIKSDAVSFLNIFACSYGDNEREALEEAGHIRNIGQQIVLATYTALEVYLIEKFKEYYKHTLRGKDAEFIQNSIGRFSFRKIDEIKRHYFEILKIHLPSFDITFYTAEECNWQPNTAWEAILLLERARNQIAHTGKTEDYKIVTLMDSWYPFEFVCEWVHTFDVEFDHMIYRGKESAIIKRYNERLAEQIEKMSKKSQ